MIERMVPAQQLSDAGEDLARLAAAKIELKRHMRALPILGKTDAG